LKNELSSTSYQESTLQGAVTKLTQDLNEKEDALTETQNKIKELIASKLQVEMKVKSISEQ